MCHFLSVIVTRSGDIKDIAEYSDSHTDIIDHFGLKEQGPFGNQNWVRVEYSPSGGDLTDLDSYVIKVDEDSEPSWWPEFKDSITDQLHKRVSRMIVSDKRKMLVGGPWIIAEDADIEKVLNCRIVCLSGGSIANVSGGSIANVRGGSIANVRGGSIADVSGGSIANVRGGSIANVSGGSIANVRGGSIANVSGGSIANVSGGSIANVSGGSIANVWGGSIANVSGGSIANVWGGSIADIGPRGEILKLGEFARVSPEIRERFSAKPEKPKAARKKQTTTAP